MVKNNNNISGGDNDVSEPTNVIQPVGNLDNDSGNDSIATDISNDKKRLNNTNDEIPFSMGNMQVEGSMILQPPPLYQIQPQQLQQQPSPQPIYHPRNTQTISTSPPQYQLHQQQQPQQPMYHQQQQQQPLSNQPPMYYQQQQPQQQRFTPPQNNFINTNPSNGGSMNYTNNTNSFIMAPAQPQIINIPPTTFLNPTQPTQQQQQPTLINPNTAYLQQTTLQQTPPPPPYIPFDTEFYPSYSPQYFKFEDEKSLGINSPIKEILNENIGNKITNLFIKSRMVPQFDDELLTSIMIGCKNLEHLNLSNCVHFNSNLFSKHIGKLCQLKSLNLNGCQQITNENLSKIANSCKHLEEIHLNGCVKVDDQGIVDLVGKCKKIKIISLSNLNLLTDRSITAICQKLSDLQSLCINHIQWITEKSLLLLKKFPLRCFYAYNTLITDVALSDIAIHCGGTLQVINVSKCKNITNASIATVAINCGRSLTKLYLQNLASLSVHSVSLLGRHCPSLSTLRLDGCINLMDDTIYSLAPLEKLNILNLSNLPKITEMSLIKILPGLIELEELYLYDNPRFSDLTIKQLAITNQRIQTLRVDKTVFVSDASIIPLANGLQFLRVLNLSNLISIHDSSILALATSQKYLQKLFLSGCKSITNDSLFAITGSLTSLEVLKIDDSFQFSEEALSSLSYLKNLKILSISQCIHTTNRAIDMITFNCRQLEQLYMCKLPMVNDAVLPSLLSNLCKLKILRIDGCINMTDRSLTGIRFLNRLCLEIFNCSETQMGGGSIVNLVQQSSIRELYAWNCDFITDDTLKTCANDANTIQTLRLDGCKNITDKGVRALIQRAPLLRILNISNTKITDETLQTVAGYCKRLKKLYINNCSKITSSGISAIAYQCLELTILNGSRCTNITDNAIIDIGLKCKFLKRLILNFCNKITENSIIKLSVNCPMLKEISLKGCTNVGEMGVLSLSTYCKRLQFVDFTDCHLVTDLAIIGIGRECLLLKSAILSGTTVMENGVIEICVRSNVNIINLDLEKTRITDRTCHLIAQMCPAIKNLNILNTPITSNSIDLIKQSCFLLSNFQYNC